MKNTITHRNIIIVLAAGGLALTATNLTAQSAGRLYSTYPQPRPVPSSKEAQITGMPSAPLNFTASSIVGLPVRSDWGDLLGKVQDLIVNPRAGSVPFAIVEYGGTLGVGETRVAVPLQDLKWSDEPKELRMSATKEQFEAATGAPTGRWMAIVGQDWLKDIDRFYGQPSELSQSRFERQETSGVTEGREPVRNPVDQNGASTMKVQGPSTSAQAVTTMTKPADEVLTAQVNAVVQQNVRAGSRDIAVIIKEGVVTLRGRIPTEEQKHLLEKQIKALPGVDRVQDVLITGPE